MASSLLQACGTAVVGSLIRTPTSAGRRVAVQGIAPLRSQAFLVRALPAPGQGRRCARPPPAADTAAGEHGIRAERDRACMRVVARFSTRLQVR